MTVNGEPPTASVPPLAGSIDTSTPTKTLLINEAVHQPTATYNSHNSEKSNVFSGENPFNLNESYAYTPGRKLRVIIIGAGFSGLLMAHKFRHRFPEMRNIVEHTIFEAHSDVGGTWLVNNYPGLQCDVPAHIYSFPFDPNPDWDKFYAKGSDIQAYIKNTVRKWNLDKNLHLNTRVVGTQWLESRGQWRVTVSCAGVQRDEYCEVLVSGQGVLRHVNWPNIPGLVDGRFKGHLTHSARWDHKFDYANKQIAIIGNGASGVQIVPAIADLPGTSVINFIRQPTWIYQRAPPNKTGSSSGDPNPDYATEEKARFQDPEKHLEYRKSLVRRANDGYYALLKGARNKAALQSATLQMSTKLGHDERLCEMLIPKWEFGCKRVTPGFGYLESFLKPTVHLTNSPIVKVTENAIHTADGQVHEVDVIVCATGYDTSHIPRYPFVGQNGRDLATDWKDTSYSYMSVAVPNYPNYFMLMGPRCLGGQGSLLQSLDWTGDYIVKWVKKMATEDIKYVHPKSDVTEAFMLYGDAIHSRLAWSGACSSWYKGGTKDGRITVLFGGGVHLFHHLFSEIRAEDFNIVYRTANRFRFLGNGFFEWEFQPDSDQAWYVEKAAKLVHAGEEVAARNDGYEKQKGEAFG